MNTFCQVAVNYPKHQLLTYKVDLEDKFEVGNLVEVPLGKRNELGCIVDFVGESDVDPEIKYKKIHGLEKQFFSLNENELKLYRWVAKYYFSPLGKLIFDALPPYLKRVKEPTFTQGEGKSFPLDLNEDQQAILDSLFEKNFETFSQSLIHGVTGSGKSIIFLELIKKVIKEGKSVQFLVPEINLTPQFVAFFSEFLDCKIFVYHSSIKNSDRFNLWRKVKELDEPIFVIGVRSSVFLPINNLGLVIVDEEHDGSFKQEDRCHFNARDVAIKKAQIENIPIILASATPSVESYYRFKHNKNLSYYVLKKRFNNSQLPVVEVVNNPIDEAESWPISDSVLSQLEIVLREKGQAIFFVNKLGFSKYIQCPNCGFTFECPNCSVSLTYFSGRKTMECHSCDYKIPERNECPSCGCLDLKRSGYGTEKIFEVLQKKFPTINIERFDRDDLKNISEVEKRIEDFGKGKIDILVGTQMISKGHNFKNVKLIGILGVDGRLNTPDFRAQEKVYQLVTQVLGRAGRFGEKSVVYLQTQFRNELINCIQNHEFDKFYENEILVRETLGYPPFSKLAYLVMSSRFRTRVETFSQKVKNKLEATIRKANLGIEILGPRSALVEKRKNQYLYFIQLKTDNFNQLLQVLDSFNEQMSVPSGVQYFIDVDPLNIV
ncbi:MAG: primosomal protein N' [Halobacteriovoraceae bacterium]|nr:primosomal protein N' [Halobacteriovoraceae bacterium]